MIRTPDVDHLIGVAGLLEVVGEVDAEVSPASICLADRPVLIIAKERRAEQRQLDRLPVLRGFSLGRVKHAIIDQAALAQPSLGGGGPSRFEQFGLRCEAVMTNAQQREVRADRLHHRCHGVRTEDRKPRGLRGMSVAVAEVRSQGLAHGLKIVARIQALRDVADTFAQRLEVAKVGGSPEDVHLCAGIVDVVLADYAVPGEHQQVRQRVPDDRSAAMPHVHRAGWIGRDIFDVHRLAGTSVRFAISLARMCDRRQLVPPRVIGQPQIDEARAGDVDACHFLERRQPAGQRLGELPRRDPGALPHHHRSVGRQVAVRSVMRRFHSHAAPCETGRQLARRLQPVERPPDVFGDASVKRCWHQRAPGAEPATQPPRPSRKRHDL